MSFCSLLLGVSPPRGDALYLSIIAEMTHVISFIKKNNVKSIGVKYEICDIDTGEMLLDIRQKTTLFASGIQGFEHIRTKFLNLVDSGRNVSLCVTCFDVRFRLDDVENIFIRNKHIDDIF